MLIFSRVWRPRHVLNWLKLFFWLKTKKSEVFSWSWFRTQKVLFFFPLKAEWQWSKKTVYCQLMRKPLLCLKPVVLNGFIAFNRWLIWCSSIWRCCRRSDHSKGNCHKRTPSHLQNTTRLPEQETKAPVAAECVGAMHQLPPWCFLVTIWDWSLTRSDSGKYTSHFQHGTSVIRSSYGDRQTHAAALG